MWLAELQNPNGTYLTLISDFYLNRMTAVELEFSNLIEQFLKASEEATASKANLPAKPVYHSSSGRHFLAEIADYKQKLAVYRPLEARNEESEEQLRLASEALDAWIPEPVHKALLAGASITSPVSTGLVALLKAPPYYVAIKGDNEADLHRNLNTFIALHEAAKSPGR